VKTLRLSAGWSFLAPVTSFAPLRGAPAPPAQPYVKPCWNLGRNSPVVEKLLCELTLSYHAESAARFGALLGIDRGRRLSDLQHTSADLETVPPGGDYPPDRRRTRLLWLALALVGLLTLAFVILVAYGWETTSADYGEPLLLIGLLALITCTVAYFADKEREHRAENRRLIQRLHETAKGLDARVARLNKLSETSMHLAGALDIDRISELVVEALLEQVHADAASLVLLDRTKGEYVHKRSTGLLAENRAEAEDPAAVAGATAGEGPRIRQLGPSPATAEQLRAWEKIRASIAAPVQVSDVIGGALTAIRGQNFDTEDLNLLTTLANMSSKAIESAELHQQLRKSYYRTLHVLARSLAARDPYSAAHGEAVTSLACRLAERLNLSKEDMQALKAFGPLHDLGKIGIADSVLSKQGPLTEEEFGAVRQHTIIGETIIRPLDPSAAATAMIRSHHERWDGNGYPDGLSGEAIPLVARIVAVADVYHATVSHRPYRGGTTSAAALEEIKQMAGTQLDPRVVETLVQLWHDGDLASYTIRLGQSMEPGDILDLPESLSPPAPRPTTSRV
jgi:response regulator RpfG family c-di-GMP phosphodiesterase